MSANANALRLAFFTAAIYVAALTIGSSLLYYLAYVLIGVLVSAFIWSRLNRIGLAVKRDLRPPYAQVGQYIEELVEIRNSSWIRKLWLEIRDQSTLAGHSLKSVISLPARSTRRWRVRTRCMRRGLYRLGPTVITTGDPFGLFQTTRAYAATTELLVYPPTVPLSSFKLPTTDLPGGNRTQRLRYQTTPAAAGIREYRAGDPMNRIHWPATARTQRLMVKEFELDPTSDVWLVLDLDSAPHVYASRHYAPPLPTQAPSPQQSPGWGAARPGSVSTVSPAVTGDTILLEPSTEEYSVAVTASLASYFVSEGLSVGLITWGQHKVVLPADRGGRQLVKILRALAVLRAEGSSSLAEVFAAESHLFARQDTLVIVTPSLADSWLAAVHAELLKGIAAAAVLIEPGTFGGQQMPFTLISSLTSLNVPTYLVKRDDSIDAALGQHFGGASVRNLR